MRSGTTVRTAAGALLVALLTSSCVTVEEPAEPVEPAQLALARAYNRAFNAHQLDSLQALYHDSVVLELVGLDSILGREALRTYNEYDKVVNGYQELLRTVVVGDTVYCSVMTERNAFWSTAGIPLIYYQPVRLVYEDSLLRRIELTPNPYSRQAIRNALGPFFAWVFKTHPEDYFEIAPPPNHRILMNGSNGHRMVRLMREFQKLPDSLRVPPRPPGVTRVQPDTTRP